MLLVLFFVELFFFFSFSNLGVKNFAAQNKLAEKICEGPFLAVFFQILPLVERVQPRGL